MTSTAYESDMETSGMPELSDDEISSLLSAVATSQACSQSELQSIPNPLVPVRASVASVPSFTLNGDAYNHQTDKTTGLTGDLPEVSFKHKTTDHSQVQESNSPKRKLREKDELRKLELEHTALKRDLQILYRRHATSEISPWKRAATYERQLRLRAVEENTKLRRLVAQTQDNIASLRNSLVSTPPVSPSSYRMPMPKDTFTLLQSRLSDLIHCKDNIWQVFQQFSATDGRINRTLTSQMSRDGIRHAEQAQVIESCELNCSLQQFVHLGWKQLQAVDIYEEEHGYHRDLREMEDPMTLCGTDMFGQGRHRDKLTGYLVVRCVADEGRAWVAMETLSKYFTSEHDPTPIPVRDRTLICLEPSPEDPANKLLIQSCVRIEPETSEWAQDESIPSDKQFTPEMAMSIYEQSYCNCLGGVMAAVQSQCSP